MLFRSIKEWLHKPLRQDMRQRLTDVLAAIEDAFDDDQAIWLLKNNMGDNKL